MKLFTKSLIIFFLIGLTSLTSIGQSDAKSTQILEAMGKKYKALPSYTVTFSYRYGKEVPVMGELGVKGEKYFLKLTDQEIYNDGKAIATFLKDSKEVTIQDFSDDQNSSLNPARIFTSYQKGYKSEFVKTATENGVQCNIVRLTPLEKNSPERKVELSIVQKDNSLKTWKITEKNGTVSNYKIEKFDTSTPLSDGLFSFDPKKFPEVEIVDLR
jgi:outer membrane lipoprotein-sorting protein